jgi:hypothetical protein
MRVPPSKFAVSEQFTCDVTHRALMLGHKCGGTLAGAMD